MRYLFLVLGLFMTAGCASRLEELRKTYRPSSAREAYVHGLEQTGIASTTIAEEWLSQGETALQSGLSPDLPFLQEGVLEPSSIMALGYRLSLQKGQHLVVEASLESASDIFIDLYEAMGDMGLGNRRVASADSTFTLRYDVARTKEYTIRIQPEILASGRFSLSIRTQASIVFPVSGKNTRAIQSRFGAPRDAGRRSHHGVDIFASRGTPVVAVRAGRITSTRIGGLGGKTVWLRDSAGHNFYYAHLDEQLVREGQRVVPGDTLGFVGNTGNARTTPPHLHFGIYQRGPHDPWPYLYQPENRLRPPSVDRTPFGSTVVIAEALRNRPVPNAEMYEANGSSQAVVIGGIGSYYHVRLDDNTEGFVPAASVESL